MKCAQRPNAAGPEDATLRILTPTDGLTIWTTERRGIIIEIYFWNAHAPAARRAGLNGEIVDALRDKKDLPALAPDELAVVNYGRDFFRTHRVSQANFDAARDQFGVLGLTELTNLLGCYAMLAFNVNAFGVELPVQPAETPLPV